MSLQEERFPSALMVANDYTSIFGQVINALYFMADTARDFQPPFQKINPQAGYLVSLFKWERDKNGKPNTTKEHYAESIDKIKKESP